MPWGKMGKPKPPKMPSKPPKTASSKWNLADLDYFDPHLDKSYSEDNIIVINKETWIRSVYLFVTQIKDLVLLKGGQTIQNNLNTALRGAAQIWYVVKLSKLECSILYMDISNQINFWCTLLVKWFKEQSGVVLVKLMSKKYSLKDAQNQQQLAKYVEAIVRHAKRTDIKAVYNQLTFAYKSIAMEFWIYVNLPILVITILDFIQTLEVKNPA